MNVQILEVNGRPAFAVLNYADYLELTHRANVGENAPDDLEDAADIAAAQAALEDAGNGERNLPLPIVTRLLAGKEAPLRVLRTFRGLSVKELAEKLGVSASHLYMVEQGKRGLSAPALKKAATLLRVDVDDLI